MNEIWILVLKKKSERKDTFVRVYTSNKFYLTKKEAILAARFSHQHFKTLVLRDSTSYWSTKRLVR
jgi:hypothetical protein